MKKLIYIISSPRSGSTLLANIFGNNPTIFNMGEVTSLNGFINGNTRQAQYFEQKVASGDPIGSCSIWSKAIENACQKLSIRKEDLNPKTRMARRGFWKYFFLNSYIKDLKQESLNQADAKRAAEHAFALFDAIVEQTGKSILVDSSKNLINLMAFCHYRPADWDLKIIYIHRNCEATAFSMKKVSKKLELKRGRSVYFNMLKCLHYNAMIRSFLKEHPHRSLSLEDLCNHFRGTAAEIIAYIDDPALTDLPLSSDNRMRYDIGGSKSVGALNEEINLKLDEKWKSKRSFARSIFSRALQFVFRT